MADKPSKKELSEREKVSASKLPKLSDAQGTVIGSTLTSAISLVVALISLIGTIYITHQSQATSTELEKLKQTLQIQNNRRDEVTKALGKATESIQKMKDEIQKVVEDSTISVSQATENLAKAADNLEQTFAEFGKDVNASNPEKQSLYESFHQAKNLGLSSVSYIKLKNQADTRISKETVEYLLSIRNRLSELQVDILSKYSSLKDSADIN
jgi:ABC-type transporter Mla subunit MlaD